MTPERYECPPDCGACCKGHFIVECTDLDVMREPRLIEADKHWAGRTPLQVIRELREDWKSVILNGGAACMFLKENQCSIYPTRPNCCVGMEAGSDQCQDARAAQNLPPLLPRND